MARLSSFHQELLTHWSSDIWVKCSVLLQHILSVPFPGLQVQAQPRAWAQPDWASSSLRSCFACAKPTLKGHVPAQQPRVGSGCMCHLSHSKVLHWSGLGFPYAGTFCCGCGLRVMVTLCWLALWDEMGFFSSPEMILFMFLHQETCHKKPGIILGDVCLLGVHLPSRTGWKKHISLVNAIAEGIKCLSALPETAPCDFASSDMMLQGSRPSSAVRHREQAVPSWLLSDLILP